MRTEPQRRPRPGASVRAGFRLAVWLGLAPLAALAIELPLAVDLRSEAEQARRLGGPLIILFSRRDCKYCADVRRDYLRPLVDNPHFRQRLLVRQIDQDSPAALLDFTGEKTSHAAFAAKEKIKLVPVVAFFGPPGRPLAEPIVGARLADFYQGYLDTAIAESIRKLHQP